MFDDAVTLIAFLFFAFVVVILVMRTFRRLLGRPGRNAKPVSYDFTLGELNDLLRGGKLSPEEFEKAKAAVLNRASNVPPPLPPAGTRGFDVLQRPEDGEDPSRDAR